MASEQATGLPGPMTVADLLAVLANAPRDAVVRLDVEGDPGVREVVISAPEPNGRVAVYLLLDRSG